VNCFFGNFRKLLEIIGKYCWSARWWISSDRFLNGELFFRKFLEIIVGVRDDESLQTGSKRLNCFFGNFRKLLENIGKYCWSARWRISSDRFFKGELFFRKFLEIFGNVRKLLEIIGKYCWSARWWISSDRFLKGELFFRKFSKIIGKYCWSARRRISSDRVFKGEFFFRKFFGNYWKIFFEWETKNLFRQVLKGWIIFSEIFGNYWKI